MMIALIILVAIDEAGFAISAIKFFLVNLLFYKIFYVFFDY